MTKLMEKAIAYLQRLEPKAQDQLARSILEESLVAQLSETERRDIQSKLAEAEADLQAGRYTEDGDAFWLTRLAYAKGMKVIT